MPISEHVTTFTLESSLDVPANRFTAQLVTSSHFLSSVKRDSVNIWAGYKNAGGTPVTVQALADGVIDSYELSVSSSEVMASVRGRDRVAELLDKYYEKIYSPNPSKFKDSNGNVQNPLNVQIVPGGPAHLITISPITKASIIAQEIVESTGLTLIWDCRDYTIQSDFEATGRIIDILRRLTEPWNVNDLLKVDIYVDGTVVHMKQRLAIYTPEYTYPITDVRIKNFHLSKRPSVIYGRVILEGGPFGRGIDETPSGFGVIYSPVEEDRFREIRTFDSSGRVISVTTIRETFRRSDGSLLVYDETHVVQGRIEKKELRVNDWESPQYGPDGQINQPLLNFARTTISVIDRDTNVLAPSKRHEVSYTYDSNKKLDEETEVKSDFSKDEGVWKTKEKVVKVYSDYNATQVQLITTTFGFDNTTGQLRVKTIDTQINSGQRPGGTQPPGGIFTQDSAGDVNSNRANVRLEEIISTDPYAVPFQFSNPNLTLADLQFIMAQLRLISGGWVYDLDWSCTSMPWIKVGKRIRFTGIPLETGTYNTEGAVILTNSLQGSAVESGNRLTAQYWKAT